MSFPWSAASNFLPNNSSTSPTTYVPGAAMSRQSSNVQASIGASQPANVRAQRPTNPSMEASAWNAPYGNAQPMNVGGRPSRNVQRQPSQRQLPAAACDFQRLSSRINPFHADFQRGQHFAPNRAPGSNHSRRTAREESLQSTPRLQNPNAQASQQLGHQRNLHRHQQAAGMASRDYLDSRGSSQPRRHVQVPNIYEAPELASESVYHGHHSTDAGNGSRHQHVGHSKPMGEAMVHGDAGQANRRSTSYMDVNNLYPDPSFFHSRRVPDHVPNRSHLYTASPYARSARTQLDQGPVPSLSGTGKKSTASRPRQGKVPVQVEDSQGPKGTEEVRQMDGQLFHRTHPEDKWGKSIPHLLEDHNTDDSPEPAVKHSAIFKDLLKWAKSRSTYRKCLYL